ncbi:MAG: PAS domain S-box protein [Elusimicrobia bacterium]|nr:PAS domain S-box protein [Elusimicrobiota bacterium]
MEKPKKPADEARRLEALRGLKILDTAPEERFDRLTRLAQSLLGAPTAFVSLVDAERVWFKSRQGLDARETPRDLSFCGHALLGPEPFVVLDAAKDPRFADNPLVVSAPNIRFYAGAPLRLSSGETMGALGVVDRIPRALDPRRIQLLRDLAVLAARELEGATLDVALSSVREQEAKFQALFDETTDLIMTLDADGRLVDANKALLAALGRRLPDAAKTAVSDLLAPESREQGAAALSRALKGEERGDIDLVFLTGSGERVLARGRASPRREGDHGGRARVVLRDVTARTRTDRRLAAGFAATKALAEAANWRAGLEGVLRGVGAAMGWSAAGAWEVDHAAGELYCADFWSAGGKSTLFTRQSRELRLKSGAGLPGRAWRDAKPVWIPDVLADPDFPRAEAAAADGVRAALAFPVTLDGKVEGVLEFFDPVSAKPDAELLDLFVSIGSQLGGFLRRRRADSALQRSAKETLDLKTALDSSAIVAATDAAGRITRVNDLLTRVSGYSREELIGVTHKILSSGKHPDAFFKQLWQTIASGRTWRGEICNLARSGAAYWVDTTITPFMGEDGKPVQYVAISHDITERKLSEARAAEAGARLQAVLDGASQVAIIAADPAGLVTVFSKGAENLLGYAAADILGKPPSLLFPEGQDFDSLVEPARLGGSDSRECSLLRKDRSALPVRLTATALRGAKGGIDGFLVLAVDNTQSQLARAEVSKARDTVLDLANAKSLFLSSIGREVRAPVNAVLGMAGRLLEASLAPPERELAEGIRDAGGALLATLGDILDFSQLEAGAMPLEEEEFDPRLIVEDVALLFAAQAREKGLELLVFVDEAVPRRLRGDSGRLRQILAGFAGNAVKFTESGEVVLGARRVAEEGGGVRLRFEVQDTGPGIEPAAQAKLFAAFSRAEAPAGRRHGGAGLELAIARKLAEMMKGSVGVVSAPGKGSNFWFEAVLPKGDAAAPAEVPELAGVRVLIVDGGETSRRVTAHLAASWRMRPDAVSDGAAALAALRSAEARGDPYILALIDRRLSGQDGEQLAQEIKGDPALVAVRMILLGPGEPSSLGLDGAVPKPVFKAALLDAVRGALGVKPSAEELARRALKVEPLASWKSLRILVAEDNPVNRKVTLLQLRSMGCAADAAADGREAAAAAAATHYDLVLMDCRMPEMDGFEATAAIRARPGVEGRRTAIIAMTADALGGDRERCLAAGMDDCVGKPVLADDLAAALGRWFGSVDPAALKGLLALGDETAVRDIIEGFAKDAQTRLDGLRAAAAGGDASALEPLAAALKGGAGTIGAKGVARLAARLEALGRDKRLEEAAGLVESLASELAEAVKLLRAGALRKG